MGSVVRGLQRGIDNAQLFSKEEIFSGFRNPTGTLAFFYEVGVQNKKVSGKCPKLGCLLRAYQAELCFQHL